MQRLVELINTTDDIELLVKLFTVLAVYLVSNVSKVEIILKMNFNNCITRISEISFVIILRIHLHTKAT